MPDVILLRPVTHDDEDLKPGDPIYDLSDKEARLLVERGAARYADDVDQDEDEEDEDLIGDLNPESDQAQDAGGVKDPEPEPEKPSVADAEPADDGDGGNDNGDDDEGEGGGSIPPVERAEIMAMPKATVIENLTAARVEFKATESTAKLREKLIQAWSEPADGE